MNSNVYLEKGYGFHDAESIIKALFIREKCISELVLIMMSSPGKSNNDNGFIEKMAGSMCALVESSMKIFSFYMINV